MISSKDKQIAPTFTSMAKENSIEGLNGRGRQRPSLNRYDSREDEDEELVV